MGILLGAEESLRTVTIRQAAILLDCSVSKARILFDAGELHGHQDPRSNYRRILLSSVVRYMDRAGISRERLRLIE